MGHPRVRPHVVPFVGKTGELTKDDYVTSFLVAWQPSPTPPAHWIELLREAPFGTQAIRARNLRWDGRSFSVELLKESDIEAFGIEMPDWVALANAEFGRRSTRRRKRRSRRRRSVRRCWRTVSGADMLGVVDAVGGAGRNGQLGT